MHPDPTDQAVCAYAQRVRPSSPSSRTSLLSDIRASPRPGELACRPDPGASGHRPMMLRSWSSASRTFPDLAVNDDRALSLASTMPIWSSLSEASVSIWLATGPYWRMPRPRSKREPLLPQCRHRPNPTTSTRRTAPAQMCDEHSSAAMKVLELGTFTHYPLGHVGLLPNTARWDTRAAPTQSPYMIFVVRRRAPRAGSIQAASTSARALTTPPGCSWPAIGSSRATPPARSTRSTGRSGSSRSACPTRLRNFSSSSRWRTAIQRSAQRYPL